MGKAKMTVPVTERRQSARLATLKPARAVVEAKKKPAAKKPPKTKKAKVSENGSAKAEEPKPEATEAK